MEELLNKIFECRDIIEENNQKLEALYINYNKYPEIIDDDKFKSYISGILNGIKDIVEETIGLL